MFKQQLKNFLRSELAGAYGYLYYQRLKRAIPPDSPRNITWLKMIPKFTKAGFYDFVLDDINFKIFLDPRNGLVDQEIFCFGHFEPGILRFIKNNLDKDSVFLDIGANIGQHSLFAAQCCKKVYSFEPIKRIHDQLQKSLWHNDIYNVRQVNIALGEKNAAQLVPIFSDAFNIGRSSLQKAKGQSVEQYIKVRSLDFIIEKAGIDQIDLVKIDVEGFELNVLLGAANMLQKQRPKIVMEYSPYIYDRMPDKGIGLKIFELLKANNYKIFDIGEGDGDMKELLHHADLSKIYQTNFFCLPD